MSSSSSSNLSLAAKDFLEEFGDSTVLGENTKKFVAECMSLPGASSGPTPATTSPKLDLSSPIMVSRESDNTLGGDEWVVSRAERRCYYNGIAPDGHCPELLYRSNFKTDPWVLPQGRFANLAVKSARSAHGTRLAAVWGDVLLQIDAIIFAAIHRSYSIDAARFFTIPGGQEDDTGFFGPAVVWVTVDPALGVSSALAHRVSQDIVALLNKHSAGDAIVEWCEGVVFQLTSPRVLPTVHATHPTAQVRRHLTTTLNMPIAPAEMEDLDQHGSIGLLFHENKTKNGRDSDKVLAVTNHHVVCKDETKLYDFRDPNSPRPKIRLCGNRRFQRGLTEIQSAISEHAHNTRFLSSVIKDTENDGDEPDPSMQLALKKHLDNILVLEAFHKEVVTDWSDIGRRDIGALVYSPPISIEPSTGYTKDFAIIELDAARCRDSFGGNEVWLGDAFSPRVFNEMMNPRNDGSTNFKYPHNGCLRIRSSATKEELANPNSLDILVLKDGTATDLTIGRCAGLESATRARDGTRSIEIAVYNYNQGKSFSRKGDSGSLIFDGTGNGKGGQGRMVALLHAGKAHIITGETYVTYGTPMWQVQEWIHDIYPNAVYTKEDW